MALGCKSLEPGVSLGRAALAVAAVACLLPYGCSETIPNSILLRLSAADEVGALDELRISVFSPTRVVHGMRVPSRGSPTLPNSLVLYPGDTTAVVTVFGRGLVEGEVVAEGTTRAVPLAGRQVEAGLLLQKGALIDQDGDGVPDIIDRCPSWSNPTQARCLTDAAREGPADAGPEDASSEGVLDQTSVEDANTDRAVADISPVRDVRSDALPTDSTGRVDATREDSTWVPDLPRCTKAADCTDGRACTTDHCISGRCEFHAVVCAPPTEPQCAETSCEEPAGCQTKPFVQGTSCDDDDRCTQRERCDGQGRCTLPSISDVRLRPATMNTGTNRMVAVDSRGWPHIVYPDTQSRSLIHSYRNGPNWVHAEVTKPTPQNPFVGRSPSVATDSSGGLHLAYINLEVMGARNLVYQAWIPASGWSAPVQLPATSGHTSIVVDDGGDPHICSRHEKDLEYHTRSAGIWSVTAVREGHVNTYGGECSIALTTHQSPRIAHTRGTFMGNRWVPEQLRYAELNGGSWNDERALDGPIVSPSLVIDSRDEPHIAFAIADSALYVGSRRVGRWTPEHISGGAPNPFIHASVVVNSADQLHVLAHTTVDKGELLLYAQHPLGWGIKRLLTGDDAGRHVSVARAASGQLHISHYSPTLSVMRYLTVDACP